MPVKHKTSYQIIDECSLRTINPSAQKTDRNRGHAIQQGQQGHLLALGAQLLGDFESDDASHAQSP